MAYTPRNSRLRSGRNDISLFPFLAVLLCTMGTLIVILMLMARQAQRSTESIPVVAESSKTVPALPELSALSDDALAEAQRQLEMEQWRLEQLRILREEKAKKVQDARISLSTSQEKRDSALDEIQRLRESLQQMQASTEETRTPRQLKHQIAEKELEIEKRERELATAENTAKQKDGSYAILPYTGSNGTRRYPIYIECRPDGAWLMPENLPLGARDFEGVLSMGNPLEAALMAKREYLLKNGVFRETPEHEQEPYPLILVRPGGIPYLYMVRSALQSWKSEYGFELVNEDWKLAYPPNDQSLSERMASAIGQARTRQEELAAMAPTLSGLSGGGSSSGGGGAAVFRPTSQGPQAMAVAQDSRLARTLRASNQEQQRLLTPPKNPTPKEAAAQGALGANTTTSLPEVSQWNVASESSPTSTSPSSAPQTGSEMVAASDPSAETSGTPTTSNASPFDQYSTQRSIAETDGQNWALENHQPSLTSLKRSISVECRPDAFILTGSGGGIEEIVIPRTNPTETVRKLAASIRLRTRSWGEPGTGMYWKPILSVRVAPRAEDAFEQLQKLLENSGLEIERVAPPSSQKDR